MTYVVLAVAGSLTLAACWCALVETGNWRRRRWGKASDREYEQLVKARQITGGK